MNLTINRDDCEVVEVAGVTTIRPLKTAGLPLRGNMSPQQDIKSKLAVVGKQFVVRLSHQFGAPEKTIEGIKSDMKINDIRADTIFQQMSARQTGVVRLLGAAALAEGADNIAVSRIESYMSIDDLAVDTVQQQFSARIKRSIEMTALLARAVVEK